MSCKDDAIRAAYDSIASRSVITFENFKAFVDGCEVYPVDVEGKIAGAIVVKDAEIHACVLPFAFKRWFNKRTAKVLNSVIKRYGYAKTKATTSDGEKFVSALGFVKRGDYYVKEALYGN